MVAPCARSAPLASELPGFCPPCFLHVTAPRAGLCELRPILQGDRRRSSPHLGQPRSQVTKISNPQENSALPLRWCVAMYQESNGLSLHQTIDTQPRPLGFHAGEPHLPLHTFLWYP